MICPHCDSPFTRIEPNTSCYTCHSCHRTFGYVVGSVDHCPRCNSTDVEVANGYMRCNNDDCRFVVCLGYDLLDTESGEYEIHPGCGIRFPFRPGERVCCPNCHPLGELHAVDPVGCAFVNEVDKDINFPLKVMFPERTKEEFFRNRTFDL